MKTSCSNTFRRKQNRPILDAGTQDDLKKYLVGNMDYPTEETRHLYAPYLQESHFYHPDHFYYSARLQQGSYKKKTKRVPKEKKKIVKTSEGK